MKMPIAISMLLLMVTVTANALAQVPITPLSTPAIPNPGRFYIAWIAFENLRQTIHEQNMEYCCIHPDTGEYTTDTLILFDHFADPTNPGRNSVAHRTMGCVLAAIGMYEHEVLALNHAWESFEGIHQRKLQQGPFGRDASQSSPAQLHLAEDAVRMSEEEYRAEKAADIADVMNAFRAYEADEDCYTQYIPPTCRTQTDLRSEYGEQFQCAVFAGS